MARDNSFSLRLTPRLWFAISVAQSSFPGIANKQASKQKTLELSKFQGKD